MFQLWWAKASKLKHRIIESYKQKSSPFKNLFIEEPNKGTCDFVYDDSDGSKKVFQGNSGTILAFKKTWLLLKVIQIWISYVQVFFV